MHDSWKDKTAVVTQGFDWQNPFAQGKVAFAVSTSVSRPFIEQAMLFLPVGRSGLDG